MAMTRAPFSADDISAAINTAARRMTSAAPSGNLRARVMTHITRLDNRARRRRWGWRLAIAGGAIGAAALTTAVPCKPPEATPAPTTSASIAVGASAETTPTFWVAPPSHVTVVTIIGVPGRATVLASSAGEIGWEARAVPRLHAPDALEIDRIDQSSLNIEPIDIAPLVVPPLPADGAGSR